jgi:DNA-binding CsgD family transcriptional regulator
LAGGDEPADHDDVAGDRARVGREQVGRQLVDQCTDDDDPERDEHAAWVVTGRSNGEMAEALFLSPATVRTRVARAMGKLNARFRAQLVVLAVRAGLVLPRA